MICKLKQEHFYYNKLYKNFKNYIKFQGVLNDSLTFYVCPAIMFLGFVSFLSGMLFISSLPRYQGLLYSLF
jgi:hypothetical protein